MGHSFTAEEIRLSEKLGLVNHIETKIEDANRLLFHLSTNVPDVDKARRKNYRKLQSFAIDSESATVSDDEFSVLFDVSFLVHVADPTRYFPNGRTDIVLFGAMCRVESMYIFNRSISMFPRKVAEELLSLHENYSDGSALTFGFKLSENGCIIPESCSIELSYISKPKKYM